MKIGVYMYDRGRSISNLIKVVYRDASMSNIIIEKKERKINTLVTKVLAHSGEIVITIDWE